MGWIRKHAPDYDPVVAKLNARTSKLLQMPLSVIEHGSPLQVAHYDAHGYYFPHMDSMNPEDSRVEPGLDDYGSYKVVGGYPHALRFLTLLCFLNDNFKGGNTSFPLAERPQAPSADELNHLAGGAPEVQREWAQRYRTCTEGAVVKPKRGTCVLFYSHTVTPAGLLGPLDGYSLHGGCEVLEGTKWILNYWIEIPQSHIDNPKRKKDEL
eukprot:TRINITY_DN21065_c0_g1_i1.p1 TRINITY_DN21065_c0_g1~~TRINITY_DN21065_c0_g1_i1.p1  ORF type:complete len:210 (+),score=71.05 TRINITY_DN21065_c0_g1_i1:3-632(+)